MSLSNLRTSEQEIVPTLSLLVPVFVDLDGTLVAANTLIEGMIGLVRHRPIKAFRFAFLAAPGPSVL